MAFVAESSDDRVQAGAGTVGLAGACSQLTAFTKRTLELRLLQNELWSRRFVLNVGGRFYKFGANPSARALARFRASLENDATVVACPSAVSTKRTVRWPRFYKTNCPVAAFLQNELSRCLFCQNELSGAVSTKRTVRCPFLQNELSRVPVFTKRTVPVPASTKRTVQVPASTKRTVPVPASTKRTVRVPAFLQNGELSAWVPVSTKRTVRWADWRAPTRRQIINLVPDIKNRHTWGVAFDVGHYSDVKDPGSILSDWKVPHAGKKTVWLRWPAGAGEWS